MSLKMKGAAFVVCRFIRRNELKLDEHVGGNQGRT